MLTQHMIHIGPIRTQYYEIGDKSAPTVVLLHEGGYGGDAPNTFDEVAKILAEKYYVVLPEMLGFGGTDKAIFFGESPYEPRLRHLSSFFEAIDIRDAHFVGNSFGGGMTLRMTMKPEIAWRMRSAVSISGAGGPFRTPEALKDAAQYNPSLEDAKRMDAWVLPEGLELPEHTQRRYESSMTPGQWEAMMAPSLRNPAIKRESSWDLPHALSASTVKTLLIAGTGDRMLEPGWELKTAEHIPDAETIAMEGTGHSPNIDQPEKTAQVLRDWFDRVDRARKGANA